MTDTAVDLAFLLGNLTNAEESIRLLLGDAFTFIPENEEDDDERNGAQDKGDCAARRRRLESTLSHESDPPRAASANSASLSNPLSDQLLFNNSGAEDDILLAPLLPSDAIENAVSAADEERLGTPLVTGPLPVSSSVSNLDTAEQHKRTISFLDAGGDRPAFPPLATMLNRFSPAYLNSLFVSSAADLDSVTRPPLYLPKEALFSAEELPSLSAPETGGTSKSVGATPGFLDWASGRNPAANRVMSFQKAQCFKTRQCRFWLDGRCTRGDECTFAHCGTELREKPNLLKTKICSKWKLGHCSKQQHECSYAHGLEDLRVLPAAGGSVSHTSVPLSYNDFGF
eukprot:Gregarina_sp_Poly_1__3038@NODE_1852_length_3208_cov_513_823941_g1201_i0_p1_GENE_NODE_1852_length_3208_cov_513_823941_g1201_i0NODE_1852_length_3208_cov_513_823941_g1201_i0_p1_ORF_typecomplete_len342_score53_13zfCCCH/PF00642_24/4_6e06zfCCCH/PF00642_24/0_018zf_CCCH_4/PF18345_1/4_2e09zf_CCCH_4/PF18345_1/6_5e02zf_CCCH_4/PF18345_1/3_1e03zfCCCH_3/PF15663_5/1_1e08zfCCCH_4/PF18044_1/9_4e07zfCCCH_4/PF18044_1/6_9e03Torus/PF16131_5/0_011Torus/PF16131_5/0_5zfCCCH_2/PF14608_6/0_00032zfCCCH_2/PF14608_6/1_9e03_